MHLTHIAKQVREKKNYGLRANKVFNDETGILIDSFNEMMGEIKQSKEHLEDQVQQRTAELENALSIKSDFLSNMSHEIRTPVHQIISYAKIMKSDWKEAAEEDKEKWVGRIYDVSGRLGDLISGLLDVSKLIRGGGTLSLSKQSIKDMVNSALQGVEEAVGYKVPFEIKDLAEELEAECDRTRILQILTNLIANGVRYGNGSTLIAIIKQSSINSERRGEVPAVHFSLSDKGIGIPEKELEAIFGMNVQSSRTKTGAGGTGIGLSIVMELIKLHGGKVWAENNADTGSTFHFIIPLESDYGKTNAA